MLQFDHIPKLTPIPRHIVRVSFRKTLQLLEKFQLQLPTLPFILNKPDSTKTN